jgi:mono/diheme cytochrome c family protein
MNGRNEWGRLFAVVLSATLLSIPTIQGLNAANVLSPAAQRGAVLVRAHCAQCHAVGRVGKSRLSIAPPFRTLHTRYPVENLEEPLAEGIITGHPSMPEFRFDPGQVNDVIAYLKTLERPTR